MSNAEIARNTHAPFGFRRHGGICGVGARNAIPPNTRTGLLGSGEQCRPIFFAELANSNRFRKGWPQDKQLRTSGCGSKKSRSLAGFFLFMRQQSNRIKFLDFMVRVFVSLSHGDGTQHSVLSIEVRSNRRLSIVRYDAGIHGTFVFFRGRISPTRRQPTKSGMSCASW